MQITIYYQDSDEYLMEKIEQKAERERRSKSSVILSIIESYFEAEKRVGEILCDLNALSANKLQEGLKKQSREEDGKKLGRILLEEDYVEEVDLDTALAVQSRAKNELSNEM